MVYIPIEKRAQIYTLLQEEYSSRFIANRENISQSTVIRIKQKKDTHDTFKDLPKPGRTRIFTGRDERNIIRLISNGDCSTAASIQKN